MPSSTLATDAARGRALLARCLDAPDDPVPAMVYADWLEERGHPLAQVIRAPSDAEADRVAAPHVARWFLEVTDWVGRLGGTFHRGMLRSVFGNAGAYARQATQRALMAVAPVFGVRATVLRGHAPRLEDCEALGWSLGLHWWDCQLDDARLMQLIRSPHLGRLTGLVLEKLRCSNRGLEALAYSPYLSRVRRLGLPAPLYQGEFDAEAVVTVLDALPIDDLDLGGPTSLELAGVVNAPAAARLRRFAAQSLSPAELGAVLRGEQLTALEELTIDCYAPVDDSALEPLLSNPALARLDRLSLRVHGGVSPAMAVRLRARFADGLTLR